MEWGSPRRIRRKRKKYFRGSEWEEAEEWKSIEDKEHLTESKSEILDLKEFHPKFVSDLQLSSNHDKHWKQERGKNWKMDCSKSRMRDYYDSWNLNQKIGKPKNKGSFLWAGISSQVFNNIANLSKIVHVTKWRQWHPSWSCNTRKCWPGMWGNWCNSEIIRRFFGTSNRDRENDQKRMFEVNRARRAKSIAWKRQNFEKSFKSSRRISCEFLDASIFFQRTLCFDGRHVKTRAWPRWEADRPTSAQEESDNVPFAVIAFSDVFFSSFVSPCSDSTPKVRDALAYLERVVCPTSFGFAWISHFFFMFLIFYW